MDSSRHLPVKTVLHARVWGVDANSLPFMQVATIRDISDTGIVVNGLVCPLKKGAVVDIQYNGSRAEFLVQWIDKLRRWDRRPGRITTNLVRTVHLGRLS